MSALRVKGRTKHIHGFNRGRNARRGPSPEGAKEMATGRKTIPAVPSGLAIRGGRRPKVFSTCLAWHGLPAVAQIFNLLYRRIVFGRALDHPTRRPLATACRVQLCDTAEYNSALRRGTKHVPHSSAGLFSLVPPGLSFGAVPRNGHGQSRCRVGPRVCDPRQRRRNSGFRTNSTRSLWMTMLRLTEPRSDCDFVQSPTSCETLQL